MKEIKNEKGLLNEKNEENEKITPPTFLSY
jgi:hypothetical protein